MKPKPLETSENPRVQNGFRVMYVLGTRPEIVKLKPVIKLVPGFVVYTGQHYSPELDLRKEFNLAVDTELMETWQRGGMGGAIIVLMQVIQAYSPDAVVVQGDTDSTLAGAIAGVKCGAKVFHVEAGLRSFDQRMPEETNRIIVDRIAYRNFCPTELQKSFLEQEFLSGIVTGNSVVDTIPQFSQEILCKAASAKKILATVHRVENVPKIDRIMASLERLDDVLFSCHPRMQINSNKVKIVPAMSRGEFMKNMLNSAVVVTDSGGIQEEACILGIPCVTVRENTERQETIMLGANVLSTPEEIPARVEEMRGRKGWKHPYGSKTAENIAKWIRP